MCGCELAGCVGENPHQTIMAFLRSVCISAPLCVVCLRRQDSKVAFRSQNMAAIVLKVYEVGLM